MLGHGPLKKSIKRRFVTFLSLSPGYQLAHSRKGGSHSEIYFIKNSLRRYGLVPQRRDDSRLKPFTKDKENWFCPRRRLPTTPDRRRRKVSHHQPVFLLQVCVGLSLYNQRAETRRKLGEKEIVGGDIGCLCLVESAQ